MGSDEQAVGQMTSCVLSRRLASVVAIDWVKSAYADAGTRLRVGVLEAKVIDVRAGEHVRCHGLLC
jgi:glycine cleavage system aminomethyltransferase T